MTDEMIVDSPAIGEKSAQTENTKDKDAETKDAVPLRKDLPETIRDRLSSPPVLPHESEERFFALFESFRNYAKPENIIDYHLVYTATACKWEADRYRFMAVAVTTNQQQAGLATLFEQTSELGLGKIGQHLVSATARTNAMKCFTDVDYCEDVYFAFEKRGYIPDGQAFLLSLPALATIERLLTSAEKRYAATMKELERRMACRAVKPALSQRTA
jgi:hypothetical protein